MQLLTEGFGEGFAYEQGLPRGSVLFETERSPTPTCTYCSPPPVAALGGWTTKGVGPAADPFDGIPRSLPALARSAKLASRLERLEAAARSKGRPADGRAPVEQAGLALETIREALGGGTEAPDLDRSTALELVGQGLRSWVGLARQLGIDPEQALREVDDARVEAARARAATGAPAAANAHQAGSAPHRYEGT